MCLLRATLCTLCVWLVTASDSTEDLQFVFPEYIVEAFTPRGLRVSVPDSPGIRLFAFHGNINKPLNNIDAGDLSKDIIKKVGGRWTFEDKNLQLKPGDTINFWLYIIRHNLGYRLDNESYMIQKLLPQPDNFHGKRPTKRPSAPSKPAASYPGRPSYTSTTETPRISKPQSCSCPVCPPASPAVTSTTTVPTLVESSTSSAIHTIVNIWAESLNNATSEKIDLVKQVEYLSTLNDHLIKIISGSGNPDLKKIKLSGRIPTSIDPDIFVRSVLREKLLITENVLYAERQEDNSIIFEMDTYIGKLKVLNAARERLIQSKIIISDIMK